MFLLIRFDNKDARPKNIPVVAIPLASIKVETFPEILGIKYPTTAEPKIILALSVKKSTKTFIKNTIAKTKSDVNAPLKSRKAFVWLSHQP